MIVMTGLILISGQDKGPIVFVSIRAAFDLGSECGNDLVML